MKSRIALLWTFLAFLSVHVSHAQTTVTTLVDIFPWDDQGQLVSCGTAPTPISRTFADPVRRNWTSLTVRLDAAIEAGTPPSTVTVAINGQTVGSVVVANLQSGICGGHIPYDFTTTSLPGYVIGGSNTITITSTSTFWYGVSGRRDAELIFDVPPAPAPGSITFDITDQAPAADRRVLLSNLHPGGGAPPSYPYPHFQRLLSRDRAIPIGLRTFFNNAPAVGIPVTLYVTDPADPSEYVAGAPQIVQPVPGSQPGDNEGSRPKLTGTGVVENANQTYSVTSGANGRIDAVLELDSSAVAGDNYRIVAIATYPDGSTVTQTSGVITAWKRLFVEKRQMYRRGAPLATNAPAGVTNIIIRDLPIASSGADVFKRNDFILLMHAPGFGKPKTPGSYYQRTYQIAQRPRQFRAQGQQPGIGLVTTNGTTTILGTRTRFNQLNSGDVLTMPSGVGGTDESRTVIAVLNNTQLTVDRPPSTNVVDQPYDVGDLNLIAGLDYIRIPLNVPLSESYSREPLVDPISGVVTLNDAVVRLGTNAAPGDYFDVSDVQLVGTSAPPWSNPFPAAYTEYIVLQPPGGTPVPRMLLPAGVVALQFIDKWFSTTSPYPVPSTDPNPLLGYRYSTSPNHQLLLVADTEPGGAAQSRANGFLLQFDRERASVLNRATVEYNVANPSSPLYGANADTVLQRTLVHEITHQWLVNRSVFGSQYGDHCEPQVAYDSLPPYPAHSGNPPAGLRFCLMSYAESPLMMPAPWNPSISVSMVQYHYRDGLTRFHIAPTGGSWHSEYLSIRRANDPWTP